MKLRVVMADDEALARRVLARVSRGRSPDVEVVAECANGFDAVKAVNETEAGFGVSRCADAEADGFEVLELIDATRSGGVRDGLRPIRDAGVRRGRGGLSA